MNSCLQPARMTTIRLSLAKDYRLETLLQSV